VSALTAKMFSATAGGKLNGGPAGQWRIGFRMLHFTSAMNFRLSIHFLAANRDDSLVASHMFSETTSGVSRTKWLRIPHAARKSWAP
jgi:hypothetical protein